MTKLKNLTIGIDWEILVHDLKTGFSGGKDKINKIIAESQRQHPELETGADMDLLEIRIGMSKNVDDFVKRVHLSFDTAAAAARKHDCVLVPLAIRHVDTNPAGGHVHAGSFESYEQIVRVHNAMIPYAPALMALSAASPSLDCTIKSQRQIKNAYGCSAPMHRMNVRENAERWGSDVCIKYPRKSTLEFRAFDSQPDPAFTIELAALYAGMAYYLVANRAPRKECLIQYAANRHNAAKYGMAATFMFDSQPISAADMVLNEIIPMAAQGLSEFGIPHGEFALVKSMARKRITVADWYQALMDSITDPFWLCGEITRAFMHKPDIAAWITNTAPTNDIQPHESIDSLVLESITVETELFSIYRSVPLPRYEVEQRLAALERHGLIKRVLDKKNAILFTRLKGSAP